MIEKLMSVLQKARRLSPFWWRMLILLTVGVFLKTLAIICWDVAATALLIERQRLYAMGADFIGASVLVSLIGFALWKLERRKGYGVVRLSGGCVAVATMALWLFHTTDFVFIPDILFILKYVFYSVLSVAFWAVAKRFVTERFTSLKFLALFCAELLSFAFVGSLIVLSPMVPETALTVALFAMIALTVVFKTIAQLAPVPVETFIRKTDGIQDVFERPLVVDIFILSFLGALARILAEGGLYLKLASTGIMPMTVLGLVWFLFGVLGLFMVAVLYHTRYIYTTLAGMLVFGGSVVFTGIAALGKHSGPVATGYLVFLLGAHFYLRGSMGLLPRVLTGGIGPRLKKRIMTAVIPLGFIAGGSVFINVPEPDIAYYLVGVGVALIMMTFHTTRVYSQVLFRMINMRVWRRGPLMLSYRRLLTKLMGFLREKEANDAIYALSILAIGNHPIYEKALVVALTHPAKMVRLYALKKIRRLYRFRDYHQLFQRLLKKERDSDVRNGLLTSIILSDKQPQKYIDYLADRTLRAGAIAAFLQLGDMFTHSAMESLQKMVESKNMRDHIIALELMAEYPSVAFTPWVARFLKQSDNEIVRKALLAAGAIKDAALLNGVIRALDEAPLQECALRALHDFGKAAFPPIEKMIMRSETPILRRKQLILFLGALPSGEGKQILLRALAIENQKLKKAVIQNILDSDIVWIHPDKKVILKTGLKKDLDRIGLLLHLREKLVNAPTHESEEAFGFFLRAVQEDIDDTRELILYQLLLLQPGEMFAHAVRILLGDSYELYLPSMGVIQDLLPNRLYQKLKPVLLLPLAQKRKNTLSGLSSEEAVRELATVIIKPPFRFNHWIRATALYALRRLGSAEGISIAESALSDPHPIVLEAAIWTLVRLQPDKEALHRQLLTIPTSRLSSISLDQLLES